MKASSVCLIAVALVAITIASGCVGQTTNQTQVTNGTLSASTALPAWIELHQGTATLQITGGTPPYNCALKAGSVMPDGFTLNNCTISGQAPMLSAGTTKRITPPFTVIVTDSTNPPITLELQLSITIVRESPVLTTQAAQCTVDEACHASVVLSTTGGTSPYHYTGSTSSQGLYPLGLSVVNPGVLSGTSTRVGTYAIYVCAIDTVGASDCGDAQVTVVAAAQPLAPPPPAVVENHTLFVTVESTERGSSSDVDRGTVTSAPAGIDCGEDCDYDYPENTTVTLTATPEDGSMFGGWSGACSGTGTCTIKMNEDKDVTAQFAAVTKTYYGTFDAHGTFSRDFPSYSTTCSWSDTISGDMTVVVIENPDGTITGWANVDSGGFSSIRSSGGTSEFECLPTEMSWSDSADISGSKTNLRWTNSFVTEGGSLVTGAVSAAMAASGGSITGTITFTMNTGGGSASDSFVLSEIS